MLRKVGFAVDLGHFILMHVSESEHCWETSMAFFHVIQAKAVRGWSARVVNSDNRAGTASPPGLHGTMNGLLKHLSNQTRIVSMDSQLFRYVNVASTRTSAPGDRLVKNMIESCSGYEKNPFFYSKTGQGGHEKSAATSIPGLRLENRPA